MTKTVTLAEMLAKNMTDPAFAAAYAKADAEYAVIEAMITARSAAGLTQAALALRRDTFLMYGWINSRFHSRTWDFPPIRLERGYLESV